MEKVVAGIAGMPGAGKSTVKNMLHNKGYSVVTMGDIIREEAKLRDLKPTLQNLGLIMLKLREEEGAAVVAKRCVPKIMEAKGTIVIVDGIRSLHEVNEFKKRFPNFSLIAIHASPKKRFFRLYNRKRSDDPITWEIFIERDLRELRLGLGEVIATADHMIINEEGKFRFRKKIYKILEDLKGDE